MKKLPRIWSRVAILCIAAFGVWLLYSGELPLGWSMAVGAVPVIAYAYIRFRILRCPNCGNSKNIPEKAVLRWNGNSGLCCPKCGKPLVFDD